MGTRRNIAALPRLAILVAATLLPGAYAHAGMIAFADNGSLLEKMTAFQVGAGTDFSIDVIGLGFAQLNGGTFNLSYDESLVAISSVVIDSYWDFDPESGSDTGINTWGSVGFDIFNNDPAVGNFRIATINLTTKSPPLGSLPAVGSTSMLDITGSQFFSDTEQLSPTIGTASISVVPVPAAVWLFGSALGLMGWLRRKAA
jgi:hypothetical protein